MANGIESRYTGIPIVPEVIEEKTRPWDVIESIYGMVKQEEVRADKKKLDWAELNAKIESSQDLKDFRSDSIDVQNRELDASKKHQRGLRDIAQQNADTQASQAVATAKTAELNSKTAYYNSISDPKRRLIAQMADPRWKELTGHTNRSIGEEIQAIDDYNMDITRAEGFTTSNNPLHIKYHMRKLKDGDISNTQLARDTHSDLRKQLKVAESFQKDLYEVTPKEIAEIYPEYAENLKTIAGSFMPQLNVKELQGLKGDQIFEVMKRQQKHVPMNKMEEYNNTMRQATEGFANRYRIDKGIGIYDASTTSEALKDIEIAPDDYTLTDERYELIEKTQDENNPLWEKWLNEEDYTFEDLKTDYEAGLKEADTGGVEEQEQQVQEQQVQEQVSEDEDVDPKTTSFSILPLDQPPATTPTFKGKKINLPMWEELMDKRLHPVTKAPLPKYDWMDDYAKMLTGDPNAVASDLLTKKGRSHWGKIK